jgi:hypothetical protein
MSEAIRDIPPVLWSRSPIILPHVIIIAKREKTLPNPPVIASTVARGSPARIPVKTDTRIRLRKGCNLSLAVKSRMQRRAKRNISTGCMF